MVKKILFVDTNAFIQVRDLKDVPWRDLFPGATAVDLMVADAVIRELDKHKTSTNERRRSRARLALQLIDKASLEPEFALDLRNAPVRLRLAISNNARIDWSAYTRLDPMNPDHQLVAEALSFGKGSAVFSHDSGPRIRARVEGIEAYKPADEWLLPAEQTDDQRRIKQLERDAKETRPNILAGFDGLDDNMSEIEVVIPVLRPLAPEIAIRLAAEYLAEHPRTKLVHHARSQLYMPTTTWAISGYDIDRYNREYSSFEKAISAYYSDLHGHVRRMAAAAAIRYRVKNDSGIAAEGLRVEFELEGEGLLLADREDAAEYFGLQRPVVPEPPRSPMDLVSEIIPMQASAPARDPVAFYWIARPETRKHKQAVLQCADFRPRRDHSGSIFVAAAPDLPKRLSLRLDVGATNLRDPVNVSVALVVAEKEVEWSDPLVQAILPEDVRYSMTARKG
ncbi:PIN domain-containing protein [Bradyrhizobium erythrophlei]|nr:PIN domain-containing protein [Bradyrhizobium erythrophlei]